MSNIPDGWIYALLSEIALIQMGQSPDSHSYNEQSEGLPFFQGKTDFGKLFPTVRKWCTEPKRVAEAGDLLLSVRAPVGPTNLAAERCCIGRGLAAIQAISPFNQKYLLHHFRNTEPWLSQQGTGSTFAGIGGDLIRSLKIPVAPLNEQKRIADKLDSLLSRVDACRDRLDRVPRILKRFRQSVLFMAMSGELTEDWRRASHQSVGWQNVLLSEVCVSITDGTHQPPPQTKSGIPFITIAAINDGRLQIDKATRFVASSYFEQLQASRKPEFGDILFSVTGSIAIPALVDVSEPFIFQRHIAILKPDLSQIISKFLLYSLCTENIKKQAQIAATGTAQRTIPLSGLRAFVIELPSVDEQQEIARRLEVLFAYADRLKSRYQEAYSQVERLTPALLTKAFSGELVPQNPDDEPSSALLDRIRAERASQPSKVKRTLTDRKPKMTKMSEEYVKEVIRQLPKNTFSFDDLCQKLSSDYESLKDILFSLLDEPDPSIVQIFDEEAQAICFAREQK